MSPAAGARTSRPLVIGYVSGDLRRHPVGYFLAPVLENHDPAVCRAHCYSTSSVADDLTARLRERAHGWVDVSALTDDALAARIVEDRIDILVDLAGHTAGNRLGAFARKPAPVQVTWAGFPGTTGLDAIDYLISDATETPPGVEPAYAEALVRLPDCYVCYAPPAYAPAVVSAPSLRQGYVSFGCFNNPAKLNRVVAALWARVLEAVPESRLLVRWPSLRDPAAAGRCRDLLTEAGIAASRIDLGGHRFHADLLGDYGNVDIALDPLPYSGGLTTLEALWMGVPVVTKPGATFAGRHSASHLTAVGLCDLVTPTENAYVEAVKRLAGDLPALARLRNGLRDRLAGSPLCNGAGFTRALESAYRDMWRRRSERA